MLINERHVPVFVAEGPSVLQDLRHQGEICPFDIWFVQVFTRVKTADAHHVRLCVQNHDEFGRQQANITHA
ncbi:MAG: hypothetical protein JWN93_330 [Hyphomicrobiales bacterium]|nr:hypothetical protein [Hyphomicrobiales bacterium]